MPFKIEKRDSYRWTVEHVLSKKKGAPDEIFKIDVEFKALSAKEADPVIATAGSDPKTFFKNVLVGWHDAPEGWDFSMEKFLELCDVYPGISAAFYRAYMESILGEAAARKN